MSEPRSTFRKEVAIIPAVAWWIALFAWALVQFVMLCIVPHHAHPKDLPPMPVWSLIAGLIGIILGIIILMIGYVNADSRRRGMNSLLWTLLVIVVPKALGFIAYFLLRKPLMMPCPKCGTSVGADFRFCPKCGYAVTPMCAHCGRSIQAEYVCCPYCGKSVAVTAS